VRLLEGRQARQDHVGVAGRLVQVVVQADHALEQWERGVEATRIRRTDDGVAGDRDELDRLPTEQHGIEIVYTYTRSQPSGWTGYGRRVDRAMLQEVAWPSGQRPLAFVCGPTPFVEAVAADLVALGNEPARVRTERFGPTGG